VTNYFVVFAIITGILYGANNFCQEIVVSGGSTGLRVIYPMGFGFLLFYVAYYGYIFYQALKDRKPLLSKETSPYFKKDGSLLMSAVYVMMIRTFLTFAQYGSMYYI
jgi:hypothetical protein